MPKPDWTFWGAPTPANRLAVYITLAAELVIAWGFGRAHFPF